MDKLVPGRECGDCDLCCIVPGIDKPEIQKDSASVCSHCGTGCDIYETRPEVCRRYYCGWRRWDIFPADWRPNISGVLAELDANVPPQFKPIGICLILVDNPLKTVRRPDFINFVAKSVTQNIAVFMAVPGPKGMQAAKLPLNTTELLDATRKSRSDVKVVLEKVLKRLTSHKFVPYVMEHSGNDVST